jgi:enolase
MSRIRTVGAREILDSRGNPTLEVDVELSDDAHGWASVPSGASTGSREAVELRDTHEKRYGGKGVLRAVNNVNTILGPALLGMEASPQDEVDRALLVLDGTPDKSRLGANALLGISLAVARAAAASQRLPLYRCLMPDSAPVLPVPFFNVLNGGVHASNNLDFQEFMIVPAGAASFHHAVQMGVETYHTLAEVLRERGSSTAVGDEGGFAPMLASPIEAVELLLRAIERAGYRAGVDIGIALDPAASEFWDGGQYVFRKSDGRSRSSEEMVALYADWTRHYPIWSIEDGLAEADWKGWKRLTETLGLTVQIVGDDLLVTNPELIVRAIQEQAVNAVLIKPNQIGTLTETLEAIRLTQSAGYGVVVSHRSGETTDDFIADLAVGTGAGQIKTGAPCRGERVAKYNRLLRIERELGVAARFAGPAVMRGPRKAATSRVINV